MKSLIDHIRQAYPCPTTLKDGRHLDEAYCVGGAIVDHASVLVDDNQRGVENSPGFPTPKYIASALLRLNPELRDRVPFAEGRPPTRDWVRHFTDYDYPTVAHVFAGHITRVNDLDDPELAWRVAEFALTYPLTPTDAVREGMKWRIKNASNAEAEHVADGWDLEDVRENE